MLAAQSQFLSLNQTTLDYVVRDYCNSHSFPVLIFGQKRYSVILIEVQIAQIVEGHQELCASLALKRYPRASSYIDRVEQKLADGYRCSLNVNVKKPEFKITSGTPKIYQSKADSGGAVRRYFCGECGSYVHPSACSFTLPGRD